MPRQSDLDRFHAALGDVSSRNTTKERSPRIETPVSLDDERMRIVLRDIPLLVERGRMIHSPHVGVMNLDPMEDGTSLDTLHGLARIIADELQREGYRLMVIQYFESRTFYELRVCV